MKNQKTELDNVESVVKNVRIVHCEIRGVTPLLMNRYTGNKEVVDRPKEEDAKERLYLLDGKIVQPAEHIKKALEKVAGSFKDVGHGKKSMRDKIKAFVRIEPVFIPHIIQDYTIDTRPIRNPTTKGRNPRHRPMLTNWGLAFDIIVKNPTVELAKVEKILRQAGETNGLGDNRPEFGQFEVVKFKPQ
jgi:hypothetical protein